ncbi:glycosyltransferase (plasmid) [Paracoccus marcusii]|uniref:glycosyltransferase n=1 Tax=Paracoccus marcusii TaxID=59779 RepID=UPI002ED17717|nr:glycosyltransferase [Paracoccus marcusii]
MDESRVLDLLRSVDALALSSIGQGEAAPVTVMEAMACGLPVICSRIGGTGDMIRDGVDGFLVPQGDVAAIVDRLRRLQSDPEFAGAMGQAARQSALVSFDHQTNARLLLSRIAEAQK